MEKQKYKAPARPWVIIIGVFLLLGALSIILAAIAGLFIGNQMPASGNVALIKVNGVITTEQSSSVFSSGTASSTDIVDFIKAADENPEIKAIILEINSPGGSPVASEEIVNAVKKSGKFTVAWIREVGASGGYWVASAADRIVASRMSITGSIGVIGSYVEFSGLLDKYNITYERLVAGKYKDIGSPFKEATPSERTLMQQKVDLLYTLFREDVANNRNISDENMDKIANGVFFLGEEAKPLGLIDEFGSRDEAIKMIEDKLGIKAEIVEYSRPVTFWDVIASLFQDTSFKVGQGIGDAIVEKSKMSSDVEMRT